MVLSVKDRVYLDFSVRPGSFGCNYITVIVCNLKLRAFKRRHTVVVYFKDFKRAACNLVIEANLCRLPIGKCYRLCIRRAIFIRHVDFFDLVLIQLRCICIDVYRHLICNDLTGRIGGICFTIPIRKPCDLECKTGNIAVFGGLHDFERRILELVCERHLIRFTVFVDVNIHVFKFAPRHTLNLMQRICAVRQVFGDRLAVCPGHKIISFCILCCIVAACALEIHLIFSALLKLCIRPEHFNLLDDLDVSFKDIFGEIFGFEVIFNFLCFGCCNVGVHTGIQLVSCWGCNFLYSYSHTNGQATKCSRTCCVCCYDFFNLLSTVCIRNFVLRSFQRSVTLCGTCVCFRVFFSHSQTYLCRVIYNIHCV